MAGQDDDSVRIALLAHDLRTPLAAMRLTAELIGNGPLDETQAEQLSILVRSIDALVQMTGELIATAGSGAATGGEPCPIADCVSDAAGLFEVAAAAKGLSLACEIDAAAEAFTTRHSSSLRRVTAALLDNAVKYTSTGGIKVRVGVASSADQAGDGDIDRIVLSVEDSGPGIDPQEQARLFRPFVRGKHGRETGPGTGLGLWGITQLVRDMGGQLSLTRPEGGGSRFEVLLPADTEWAEPGASGEHERETPRVGPSRAVPAEIAASLPRNVLIVDDNETNCRLLEALLESFGISSEIARSGEQAIGLVAHGNYDAALLDLHMPGMSGLETAEELRKLKTGSELPLVAVTAALESVGDERLHAAGFQDILTKPLSPAALFEVVQKIGGQRRTGEQEV